MNIRERCDVHDANKFKPGVDCLLIVDDLACDVERLLVARLLPVVATASEPFQERAQAPCYFGFRGCNGATLKEHRGRRKP